MLPSPAHAQLLCVTATIRTFLFSNIRDHGQRGEPGTLTHLHAYAARHGLGLSGVYARMDRLARTIRQHPWFDEVTAPFRPLRRAA